MTAWPFFELFLATYTLASATYALVQGHYLAIPFLLLYVAGAGHLGARSLMNAFIEMRQARRAPVPLTAPSP